MSGPPPGVRPGPLAYQVRRVRRHLRWGRSEGWGRIVEEDRLDPRERLATAWAKHAWRRRHGVRAGEARPVYVVGLQRSGTNMLTRGLDSAPEIEVRGENDRTVFERFRLRDTDVLVRTVRRSRHRLVLVKPLCDSQHVDRLLDLPGVPGGRALWVFREPDARARSEVARFGEASVRALRAVADGVPVWQGERLPPESVELVRSLDPQRLTAHEGALVLWSVRNGLFFDLGLDRRPDCLLVGYDRVVADPAAGAERICRFVDLVPRPDLFGHVEPRLTHGSAPLEVGPRVRALADATWERLRAADGAPG